MSQLISSTLNYHSPSSFQALLNVFMALAFIGLYMGMFFCLAHAIDYPFYRRKLWRDWKNFQEIEEPLYQEDHRLWQRLIQIKPSNPFIQTFRCFLDSRNEHPHASSILESIGLIRRLRHFETMNSLLPISGLLGTLVGLAGVLQTDGSQMEARSMYFAQMLLTTIISLVGQGIGTLFVSRDYEYLGFHYQALWDALLAERRELSSATMLNPLCTYDTVRKPHE